MKKLIRVWISDHTDLLVLFIALIPIYAAILILQIVSYMK